MIIIIIIINIGWQDADHIHEGLGFLPQHLKMSNIFELGINCIAIIIIIIIIINIIIIVIISHAVSRSISFITVLGFYI